MSVVLADAPPPALSRPFRAPDGISGRLPKGWHVLQRRLTGCTNPAQILALAGGGRALIVVEEAGEPPDGFPPRPRRLMLVGRPHRMSCCQATQAPGWELAFRTRGRGLYVFAYGRPRAKLESVVNDLRFAAAPRTHWHTSHAVGVPSNGQLVGGVELPSWGRAFYTWDPLLHRQPDRAWRRWGTARLVRTVLGIAHDFAVAHAGFRIGIGDLSRPRGGWFGPKHVSHQNGLDVDVYYPRLDWLERPPDRPEQINRPLAQDLVDRFVRAGAVRIFIGPHTGLVGPPSVVQVLAGHDNHLHVRIR